MKDYQYMKHIVDAVKELKLNRSDFEDELIDHYCSLYEGRSTSMASEQNLSEILLAISSERFYKKTSSKGITTKRIGIVACMLSFLFYVNTLNTKIVKRSCAEIEKIETSDVLLEDPPYGLPVEEKSISSGFGKRMHPISRVRKFHKGVDFKAKLGTKVMTVESGVVNETGYDEKNGNYIEITHDEVYTTRYHHLHKVFVNKGDQLKKGGIIGEVGSTGESTGPHLHYEILKNGENVDPSTYL